ncbi:DEAD/DEAH box helicase [Halioglobus maricola]|uniref:DEAD/DEAH box helicase n=1 Tax=Halioglobus maricola TaxID=2601894 RepID=A0A5P9NGJ4_9GAMM|nr:DEAD/DEAH box helicase [Halioglobus maricola]QFU74892.1 DEAD/DEAH box helicase [Halioglobus maricola]
MLEELELDRGLRLSMSELGFEQATEVQQAVVPAVLEGSDLRVTAETGSGKTLAYLLPALQRMLANKPNRNAGALAVVLVPTRELARQVLKNCRDLMAKTPLSAQAITGGADFKYQRALLRKNPEVIIATPGRLLEHCEKRSADLASLQTLVLDEADRMLDMGFRDEVLKVAEYCGDKRQVILLSATLRHKGLAIVTKELLHEPKTITVNEVRAPHSSIHHQRILADSQEHKDRLLVALMQNGGFTRALVFANKRITAERLSGLMGHHDLRCGSLHGDLSTEERKHVLTQYRDSKIDIISASDVAARGLDVKEIDLVVNYDLPRSGDDYLHRTGRTGRAGSTGLAVSLVSANEWNLMVSIQRYLKTDFEKRALPGLKAKYAGPKKTKGSGKAAGSKKKPKTTKAKAKSRARNQKAKGRPGGGNKQQSNDGFAPLMKKKKTDD